MKIIKRRNSRLSDEDYDYNRYFNYSSSWDIKNGLVDTKKMKQSSCTQDIIFTDQYRII